jgi:hypothetical protein
MRHLIFRFTLPLTLVSFALITKWWYGIAIDAKDVFLYGFPLIHKCEGFHASLSTQYFLFEMLVNLLTYFMICLAVTLIINRFWKIRIGTIAAVAFWVGFGIFMSGVVYMSNELDDRFSMKRDFQVKIFDSGFTVLQVHSTDREKYSKAVKDWIEKNK